MSKKRTLIFMLVLLPLALGGAVVASLANGSRSVAPVSLPVAATPEGPPSDATDERPALIVDDVQDDLLFPYESTRASSDVQPPRLDKAPLSIPSKAAPAASNPVSTQSIERDIQVAALTSVGEHVGGQSRNLHHRSWGAVRTLSGGGGGGGGDRSVREESPSDPGASAPAIPSNSDEHETLPSSGAPTEGSAEDDSGSAPGEGEGVNHPPKKHDGSGSRDDESSGESDPIDDSPHPPIYIPPRDTNPPVVSVPEPATLGLLGLGLLGCAVARRRRAA